jgi:hypothetical protein
MSASTGTVSLANIRLSLAGTAFVDFSAAGTLTPYLGYRLALTDSAGKKAIGYIKAAGTGETLGDVLNVSNCINSVGYPYETFDGTSATGFRAISTGDTGSGGTAKELTYSSGGLYKTVYTYAKTSGGNVYSAPALNDHLTDIGVTVTKSISGEAIEYTVVTTTVSDGTWKWSTGSAVEFAISNLAIKQVLTPSATGVTIVSTPGGTTYNWASIESGFNYNDSSGYTYAVYGVTRRKSNWQAQYNYYYKRGR